MLCLATHALFLYGQIEPMWRLAESQSVDVWYNATGMTARWAYGTLGLPSELNIARESNSTIQTFTYSFAIKELWQAKGMPGFFLPRLAAILLAALFRTMATCQTCSTKSYLALHESSRKTYSSLALAQLFGQVEFGRYFSGVRHGGRLAH